MLGSTYQAKDHKLLPFIGRREDSHPLLWVVTENNMVGDRGKTKARFAPAPRPADLTGRTREAVMDDAPWTYRVSSEEVRREGRVSEAAAPGSKMIPDPRRFVFLEACAPGENVTVTFAVGLATPTDDDRLAWYASDRADPAFGSPAIPTTSRTAASSRRSRSLRAPTRDAIRALRVQAYTRPPGKDEAPLPPGTGRARLLRVNRLFMLDANDEPGPNLMTWTGEAALVGEGAPHELPVEPAP